MKKRRFSITKEQAEIIRLALETFIEIMNYQIEIGDTISNNSMYEKWRKAEAELIKEALIKYQWEV